MSNRFTVTDLRRTIAQCNDRLQEYSIPWKLVDAPRNGYQAVDRHYINEDGSISGSCSFVNSGTSREVAEACHKWVNGEISRYTYVVLFAGNILYSGNSISSANRVHQFVLDSTFHKFYDGKEIK